MTGSGKNGLLSSPMDKRKFLLGAGMAGAAAVAWARMPVSTIARLPEGSLEELVPDQIGKWRFATKSGVVLPPSDALSDRLYDNLITRVYTDPAGEPLMMLIAYNNRQDGVLQIHRPEICYPAGGFTLSPTQSVDFTLADRRVIPARTFLARSRERRETVMYFTRVGTDFPGRWSEQRLSVIRANLAGVIPDGMLFRVSKFGRSMPESLASLEQFTNAFTAVSPPRLNSILFGSSLA